MLDLFQSRIAAIADGFSTHIDQDEARWQTNLDLIVDAKAQAIGNAVAQAMDEFKALYQGGQVPETYDFSAPLTIVSTAGTLLTLLGGGSSYTFTANGSIICAAGAVLSVAKVITIAHAAGGTTTWTSPLSVLGIPIGGDKNPSDYIPVRAGDVLTVTGIIGVGESLSVKFYPVKAIGA